MAISSIAAPAPQNQKQGPRKLYRWPSSPPAGSGKFSVAEALELSQHVLEEHGGGSLRIMHERSLHGAISSTDLEKTSRGMRRAAIDFFTEAFEYYYFRDEWLASVVNLLDRIAVAYAREYAQRAAAVTNCVGSPRTTTRPLRARSSNARSPNGSPKEEALAEWLAVVLCVLKLSPAEAELETMSVKDIIFQLASGCSRGPGIWDRIVQAEFRIYRLLDYHVALPTAHDIAVRIAVEICAAGRRIEVVPGDTRWAGLQEEQVRAPRDELTMPTPRFTLLACFLVELAIAHVEEEVYRHTAPPAALALAALHLALHSFGDRPRRCAEAFDVAHRTVLQREESNRYLPRLVSSLHQIWQQPPEESKVMQKWSNRDRKDFKQPLPKLPTESWHFHGQVEHPVMTPERRQTPKNSSRPLSQSVAKHPQTNELVAESPEAVKDGVSRCAVALVSTEEREQIAEESVEVAEESVEVAPEEAENMRVEDDRASVTPPEAVARTAEKIKVAMERETLTPPLKKTVSEVDAETRSTQDPIVPACASKTASQGTKHLKRLASKSLAVGRRVRLKGLVAAVKWNGQAGIIEERGTGKREGRWMVKMDCNGTIKHVKPENLEVEATAPDGIAAAPKPTGVAPKVSGRSHASANRRQWSSEFLTGSNTQIHPRQQNVEIMNIDLESDQVSDTTSVKQTSNVDAKPGRTRKLKMKSSDVSSHSDKSGEANPSQIDSGVGKALPRACENIHPAVSAPFSKAVKRPAVAEDDHPVRSKTAGNKAGQPRKKCRRVSSSDDDVVAIADAEPKTDAAQPAAAVSHAQLPLLMEEACRAAPNQTSSKAQQPQLGPMPDQRSHTDTIKMRQMSLPQMFALAR